MAKLTEKQLISQLRELKIIKPNKEWASLLKSQILAEKQVEGGAVSMPAVFAGILNIFSGSVLQKRAVYALATVALLFVGVLGFAQYTMPGDLFFPLRKITEQSAIIGKTTLNQDIAQFNNRINDLAQVSKQGRKDVIPSAINEVKVNASELAKNIKNNSVNDPTALKEIATSLKTLADVSGTDLTKNADVQDLYQTVVQNQIEDLKKQTLTDEQKIELTKIEKLYADGKYSDALEAILLIDNK
jgi:hypothetical protein